MGLLRPWILLGLLAVAVAAALALVRPRRRERIVGSLRLWQETLEALGRGPRRSRRTSVAWIVLLAGALIGLLACCGPYLRREVPSRRVAVVLYPGAEFPTFRSAQQLRNSAAALLSRLSADDRVRVVLPSELPGEAQWMSPRRAIEAIRAVKPVPIPARELTAPPVPAEVQHTYYFVPASLDLEEGPDVSVVPLAPALPSLTVERMGAVAGTEGSVAVYLAVRNRTSEEWLGSVGLEGYDPDGKTLWQGTTEVARIGPGRESSWVLRGSGEAAAVGALAIAPGPRQDATGCSAFLVRRPRDACRVAIVGRDNALLRRYVDSDPYVVQVQDLDEADLLLANRTSPAPAKPALIIAPSTPPPGWRLGDTHGTVVLGDASIASDHPVLKDVDLGAVAVRSLETWAPGDSSLPGQKVLATIDGDAFLIETGPPTWEQRRLYLSCPVAPEGTNLATTDAFVVFMANAVRYLCPGRRGQAEWEYHTPLEAGSLAGADLLIPALQYSREESESGGYRWPGLWRGPDGALEAINLTGLPEAAVTARASDRSATVPLPRPLPRGENLWLGRGLLLLAALLWLVGWMIRDYRRPLPERRQDHVRTT